MSLLSLVIIVMHPCWMKVFLILNYRVCILYSVYSRSPVYLVTYLMLVCCEGPRWVYSFLTIYIISTTISTVFNPDLVFRRRHPWNLILLFIFVSDVHLAFMDIPLENNNCNWPDVFLSSTDACVVLHDRNNIKVTLKYHRFHTLRMLGFELLCSVWHYLVILTPRQCFWPWGSRQ